MNIKDLFFKRSLPSVSVTTQERASYLQNIWSNISDKKISTNFDFSEPFYNNVVFACTNLISDSISRLPLSIYRVNEHGRKVEYKEHRWYKTIKYNPALSLSTKKWLGYSVNNALLSGNAFYWINPTTTQLQFLPELEKLLVYENDIWYKFKGIENWLPARDIVHIYKTPKNGMIGLGFGVIDTIKGEMKIQKGSENAMIATLENGLFANIVLQKDFELGEFSDPQKIKEFLSKLDTEYQGFRNAGKVPILPPLYKVQQLTPQQYDWLAQNRVTSANIAMAFSVPESFVSSNNPSTYGKAEEQSGLFFIALQSWASVIVDELQNKLLTVDERMNGVTIEFDFSEMYTVDPIQRASYLKVLQGAGALTANEFREKMGFKAVDGHPGADALLVQMQYQSIDKAVSGSTGNNNLNFIQAQPL